MSRTTQTSVNAAKSSVTTHSSQTGTSRPCHSSHATASSSTTNTTATDVKASMLAVIAITPQRRQRHAFVEDAHILSFPPPSQGAIEKPSRNGMALKCENQCLCSMPVRAMIERDDEREQQQIYADYDHETCHCRSSKYFSAALTIQHCASNFSSFVNSYLTASEWSCDWSP